MRYVRVCVVGVTPYEWKGVSFPSSTGKENVSNEK